MPAFQPDPVGPVPLPPPLGQLLSQSTLPLRSDHPEWKASKSSSRSDMICPRSLVCGWQRWDQWHYSLTVMAHALSGATLSSASLALPPITGSSISSNCPLSTPQRRPVHIYPNFRTTNPSSREPPLCLRSPSSPLTSLIPSDQQHKCTEGSGLSAPGAGTRPGSQRTCVTSGHE